MTTDHKDFGGDPAPSSSSGSGGSTQDDLKLEKTRSAVHDIKLERTRSALHGLTMERTKSGISRRGTFDTATDIEAPSIHEAGLHHTHTHTLGVFTLRTDDDTDPSDWWFASTAIPLIAATFAPMANVMSIAALVTSWRNNITTPGPTADPTSVGFPDPHWCIALNAASLACGFLGNLFLLFNFTKRVRYIVALPTTIIMFYFATGILIAITSSMDIYVPPVDGQIYSQGFWHAVIAACLYLFNSMILMVNMLGYFLGHYPQHFTLTDEQRNLILQTILFFIWLAGGGAVFAVVNGWSFCDSIYFADVTILTVGFGDFYATNDVGRGLVFPFSVGGIIILGLMVSSIHKFAGELSKDKVIRAHMETNRKNTLSRATTMEKEQEVGDKNLTLDVEKAAGFNTGADIMASPLPVTPGGFDQSDRKVVFNDPEKDLKLAKIQSSDTRSPKSLRLTIRAMTFPLVAMRRVTSTKTKTLIMREEKDRFEAMREIQHNANNFKKWYALSISVFAFGLLWCVGAVAFWQMEQNTQGMTYFQALYFCYVSLLTIGYGDLSPKSNAGKPFFIVWSLIAVPTMTILISDMGDTVIASFKRGTFKIADWTVLPKHGLYRDLMEKMPFLWEMIQRIALKRRLKQGFSVSDEPDIPTIQELAEEHLTDAELTKGLAFAIRQTADDMKSHNTKRYSYEEWVEFSRLIRFTRSSGKQVEFDEAEEGVLDWDWLEENSPLLSEQSEPEWVLDRLCESLLRLIKRNKLGSSSAPMSMADVALRMKAENLGKEATAKKQEAEKQKEKEKEKEEAAESKRAKKQERATGAYNLLKFFTGDTKGPNAYATKDAQWSGRAQQKFEDERKKAVELALKEERSRAAAVAAFGGHGFEFAGADIVPPYPRRGSVTARKGPFAAPTARKGPFNAPARTTGAMGGGRGGAGSRQSAKKAAGA